jgi:hypothetical protein
VIGAFDRLALAGLLHQLPGRQGGGAVGADVAHPIDGPRAGAADQDGFAHDLIAFQPGRGDVARQGDEIPGVGDESLAERLGAALGRGGFGLRGLDGSGVCGLHARLITEGRGVCPHEVLRELYNTK